MKNKVKLLVTAVFILSLMFTLFACSSPTVSVLNAPEYISNTGNHPGNNRQHNASVWLGCENGNLYFLIHDVSYRSYESDYHQQFSVFEDKGARKIQIIDIDNPRIIGTADGYLYYWKDGETSGNDYLYCYNIKNEIESFLYQGDLCYYASIFFDENGSIAVPITAKHDQLQQFVHIQKETVLSTGPQEAGYRIGNKLFTVVSEYGDVVERVVCTDANGVKKDIPLGSAHKRSIIPCNNGLIIHNEGLNELLYWIDEEGNKKNIFSVPCLGSESAVNVCGSDVYLSFKRYEKYGEIGQVRYENDELEGTYCISLVDFSVRKLNNQIFNGLYNFDDTCLYCCDEKGGIFRMDFGGNVTPILIVEE